MVRNISALLGRNPFSVESTRTIEGIVSREQGQWVVRIREYSGREFLGLLRSPVTSKEPSCTAIEQASTLAIVLAVEDAPRIPSWPTLTIVPRAVVSLGLLPGVAQGMAMAGSVEGPLLEVSAGLLWLPESVADEDRNFSFGLSAGWIGACLHLIRFAQGSASACANVFGGAVHAVVSSDASIEATRPGERTWAALSFSPKLRLSLPSPFVAELGVEMLAPLVRYNYVVQGRTEGVFTGAPIAAMTFLGLGLSIP